MQVLRRDPQTQRTLLAIASIPALDSAVFSFVAPVGEGGGGGLAACLAAATAQQACGALYAAGYAGSGAPAVGSCRAGAAGGCCMLNPYKGCTVAGGAATPAAWGNCTTVVFGGSGVLPP